MEGADTGQIFQKQQICVMLHPRASFVSLANSRECPLSRRDHKFSPLLESQMNAQLGRIVVLLSWLVCSASASWCSTLTWRTCATNSSCLDIGADCVDGWCECPSPLCFVDQVCTTAAPTTAPTSAPTLTVCPFNDQTECDAGSDDLECRCCCYSIHPDVTDVFVSEYYVSCTRQQVRHV